ncbi:MAG: MFS transporter [Actinobacteria bacterium]|nr:MAG: MFS transporter [Actinomycetota bacterium]
MRSPVLLWSMIVFLLYAGVAAGTGAWAFTYLAEERGISDGVAGIVVTGYWAAFTASRFVLSAIGERVTPNAILAMSGPATVCGFAIFWWAPTEAIGLAALIFTGFAHGPVFPLEVLLTPRRFGAALTATVVGYEIGAANIGGAIIPGGIGLLVGAVGLTVVPGFLFVNGVLLWAAIRALRAASDRSVRSIATGAEIT